MTKTKRSKATDISIEVKRKVFERDRGRCVVCGNNYNVEPNAHIVRRTKGGLGIETNIVTLCNSLTKNKCHYKFDNTTKEEHDRILKIIIKYMKSIYPDWDIADQQYKKWSDR